MERVLNLTFFIYTLHKMWSSVFGHHPIWGLLEALPMYTFGHHKAPGQRFKPSRPRYLKGTTHMLSCMLYLLLPLNWFSLTVFTWQRRATFGKKAKIFSTKAQYITPAVLLWSILSRLNTNFHSSDRSTTYTNRCTSCEKIILATTSQMNCLYCQICFNFLCLPK